MRFIFEEKILSVSNGSGSLSRTARVIGVGGRLPSRMVRWRLLVLIIVSCVVLVACSTDGEVAIETSPTAESEESTVEPDEPAPELEEPAVEEDGALRSAAEFDQRQPPPVEIVQGESVIPIAPTSYCWGEECASGEEIVIDELTVVAATDGEIRFRFPIDGWRFSAFASVDGGPGRNEIDVESLGDGEFSVVLTDPTQPVVDLFGQGPTPGLSGDVGVTFLVQ